MRTLQDTSMTRRHAKKHPKRPSKKKITGTVINLTPKQITLATAKGTFIINRTSHTKVISGTLRRLSTVTVEFNADEGSIAARGAPGKRTETGTVIKLTAQQITLNNTTPDPGTWIINRTGNTKMTSGTLTVGSKVTVEFNEADGQLLPA
jgi:hypothetical protein